MKMSIEEANELDLPYSAIEWVFVEHRRWFVDFEVIFIKDGNPYACIYGRGATEEQEDSWTDEEFIEYWPVVPVETTVTKWVKVDSGT